MSGGKAPRAKGDRLEREVVKALIEAGVSKPSAFPYPVQYRDIQGILQLPYPAWVRRSWSASLGSHHHCMPELKTEGHWL